MQSFFMEKVLGKKNYFAFFQKLPLIYWITFCMNVQVICLKRCIKLSSSLQNPIFKQIYIYLMNNLFISPPQFWVELGV